jgi:hypothetical protein
MHKTVNMHHSLYKAGLTRTDKIGVGPGGDTGGSVTGGTDISCNLYGQTIHVADRKKISGRPPTCRRHASDPLDTYAGLVGFVLYVIWRFCNHATEQPVAEMRLERESYCSVQNGSVVFFCSTQFWYSCVQKCKHNYSCFLFDHHS